MANHKIVGTVKEAVDQYIASLDGETEAHDVYKLIMDEVECALIRTALEYHDYNQSQAAKWLGITRNTLKKKMQLFGLCESR